LLRFLILLGIAFLPVVLPGFGAQADPRAASLANASRELIQQGKIVPALQKLSELEKLSAKDPEAKFALGEILQELAAARAEQLQRVAPDSEAAHELVGKTLEAQGKLDEALNEYRQALAKDPNAAGVHFLIGNVEWKLRNLDAASSEFAAELKVNPHHAVANLRMGQILLDTQRDDPTRAVGFLRESANDAQDSLEAHRELGKALRLARQYAEAEKELQFVESRAPNDESVHAQLAALYKDTGDRERARREIELHAKILREKLEASQRAHSDGAH
jgi:Flp pilus assembly protein TadD